jgi:hypothetical protein
MKKWIKIIGFSFMGLFIAALLFPLLFKNKAKEILKTEVSKVSGIKVDFKDLSISIISSFPDLGLKIDSLSLKDSMKEVLFDAKEVAFVLIVNDPSRSVFGPTNRQYFIFKIWSFKLRWFDQN